MPRISVGVPHGPECFDRVGFDWAAAAALLSPKPPQYPACWTEAESQARQDNVNQDNQLEDCCLAAANRALSKDCCNEQDSCAIAALQTLKQERLVIDVAQCLPAELQCIQAGGNGMVTGESRDCQTATGGPRCLS